MKVYVRHLSYLSKIEIQLFTNGSFIIFIFVLEAKCSAECTIPFKLRGTWFSWENGRNTLTDIDDTTMTGKGRCMDIREERYVNYTTSFKRDGCYTCVKFLVRTTNIIEKMESKSEEKSRRYNFFY